jgi:glutamyl-Q tRNA(Asp) synthetase
MAHLERFAPSPTGPLHLGHAFSALTAWDRAQANNGSFLLRIEDIDLSRARPAWEAQIFEDLAWLGIRWPKPVLRQSTRLSAYRNALENLWQRGLLYPCTCSRRDIAEATQAPQEGTPLLGPDGVIYPGTCRSKPAGEMPQTALRLNLRAAMQGAPFHFEETGLNAGLVKFTANEAVNTIGDIVLARRDMGTSYHLSVVLDDAFQGVTHVTRGQDLFEATKIHVILQKLLGLPTPTYHHHRLIRDENGKRLAKRDDARAIAKYRAEGATPEDIRHMVGL